MSADPNELAAAAGAQTPPAQTPKPSFGKAKAEAAEARARELSELATASTDAPPTSEAPPTEIERKPFDYDAWIQSAPEEARTRAAQEVAAMYDAQFKTTYGPEVYALLEEAKGDPDLNKRLSRLSDKQLRKFALETAYDIYTPEETEQRQETQRVDDERVTELQQRVDGMENQRRQAEYERSRGTELQALINSNPELRWQREDDPAGKRVKAIIDQAHRDSIQSGRVVTFAETLERFRTIEGAAKPQPKIPNTSRLDAPGPQAPRTKAESETAMRNTLNRNGGFFNLARSIASTKR